MPELPEVEHFRRLLLPLCSTKEPLTLKLLGQNHNKKFMTLEQTKQLNKEKLVCQSIERRGKLICMVLAPTDKSKKTATSNQDRLRYLYVHMGMTGSITTPERVPCFGHVDSRWEAPEEYPPRFSYLQFSTPSADACFSDPRKFGYVSLVATLQEFESLAPDALTEAEHKKEGGPGISDDAWCNYSTAIKSVMLDQKKVAAGIGNWIADEVLYQTQLHPLQSYLTLEESKKVNKTLKYVLQTAVSSSDTSSPYPEDWLFHVRWGKGKKTAPKDAKGRTLKFIDAAGRTSAIVPSIQVVSKQGRGPAPKTSTGSSTKQSAKGSSKKVKAISSPPKATPAVVKSEAAIKTVTPTPEKRKRKSPVSAALTKKIKQEKEGEPSRGKRRSTRLSK